MSDNVGTQKATTEVNRSVKLPSGKTVTLTKVKEQEPEVDSMEAPDDDTSLLDLVAARPRRPLPKAADPRRSAPMTPPFEDCKDLDLVAARPRRPLPKAADPRRPAPRTPPLEDCKDFRLEHLNPEDYEALQADAKRFVGYAGGRQALLADASTSATDGDSGCGSTCSGCCRKRKSMDAPGYKSLSDLKEKNVSLEEWQNAWRKNYPKRLFAPPETGMACDHDQCQVSGTSHGQGSCTGRGGKAAGKGKGKVWAQDLKGNKIPLAYQATGPHDDEQPEFPKAYTLYLFG